MGVKSSFWIWPLGRIQVHEGRDTRRRLTVAVVIWLAVAATGCAKQEDSTAKSVDAAPEDRTAPSSDSTTTNDTRPEVSLELEHEGHPQQCDPESWLHYQYENAGKRYAEVGNPPEAGPPPYDKACRPAADRTCETVCDCKFAFVSSWCLVIGINVDVPWNHWPFLGKNPSSGLCDLGIGCYFTLPLEERTLDCIDGSCVALGKGADEEMEAMLEFQATIQVRHLEPEEYTNEPVVVGQIGMGFQCDGLAAPASAVKADDRCAVLHGVVESASTAYHAKVVEGSELLGLDGVQVVWDGQELALSGGEVLFGNEDALGPPITGIGSCPRVLITESNTLYEGWFGENGYCEIPFIFNGVTYLAMVGMEAISFGNCVPWGLSSENEVYLFVRYIAEDDRTYIITPFIVQAGTVQSPCCPTGQMTPASFEEALAGLLKQ